MNKTQWIAATAQQAQLSQKDTEKVLNAALSVITATLAGGGKVQLQGFGTFETRQRTARMGRNPATGEPAEIAAARLPQFKPGKALKEAVGQAEQGEQACD